MISDTLKHFFLTNLYGFWKITFIYLFLITDKIFFFAKYCIFSFSIKYWQKKHKKNYYNTQKILNYILKIDYIYFIRHIIAHYKLRALLNVYNSGFFFHFIVNSYNNSNIIFIVIILFAVFERLVAFIFLYELQLHYFTKSKMFYLQIIL